MEDIIETILNTPLPVMLIVAGLLIIILAFVDNFGDFFKVSPEQKKFALPTGLFLLVLGLVLNFGLPGEEPPKPDTMTWGLRSGSPPVSYRTELEQWKGICPSLLDLLEEDLQEKPEYKNITIKREAVTHEERFQKTVDGTYSLECGPDTISEREGIQFSEKFHRTPVKILTNPNYQTIFETGNVEELESQTIATIEGSTTIKTTKDFFSIPEEDIKLLKNRAEIIEALKKEEIIAAISDEILLNEILKELRQEGFNAFIILDNPVLSHDEYGLVLPQNNQEWINLINNFLEDKAEEIQEIIERAKAES